MTDPIRACDDHGQFSGDRCPVCGAHGVLFLRANRRRQLSKFLSGALRHFPDEVGIRLDERGWTEEDDLVSAVEERYEWAGAGHVSAVIATDPKGRFERIDSETEGDGCVRAAYGHSVEVSLEPTAERVPDELYHGTAPQNLQSIRTEGLRPMERQQVHLSEDVETAVSVGRRHASDPVVLVVDAVRLSADGYRVTKRGFETYTTDVVPPSYLTVADL